jgi:hypothetical protein
MTSIVIICLTTSLSATWLTLCKYKLVKFYQSVTILTGCFSFLCLVLFSLLRVVYRQSIENPVFTTTTTPFLSIRMLYS